MQQASNHGCTLCGDILKAFTLRRLQAVKGSNQNTYYENCTTLHDFLENNQSLSADDQNAYYLSLYQLVQGLSVHDKEYIERFASFSQSQTLHATRQAVKKLFEDVFLEKITSWLKIAAVMELVAAIIIRNVKHLIIVSDVTSYFQHTAIDPHNSVNSWIDSNGHLSFFRVTAEDIIRIHDAAGCIISQYFDQRYFESLHFAQATKCNWF
ncbi:uncharacterized protein [Watersipora subatra]|uniref:uncharacterized protein n=1 Tax=Watersipora subatra TaxID=2589382 RepID=UPI00355BE384